MLLPKKVKHRKWHKGRRKNRAVETRGLDVSYGDYGLKAMGSARLTSRQIESARKTMTGYLKREGRVFIRVFPDRPITKRPPELTMGGGKGPVDHYVFLVRPGRIIFEIAGVSLEKASRALQLAAYKLPFGCKIVARHR